MTRKAENCTGEEESLVLPAPKAKEKGQPTKRDTEKGRLVLGCLMPGTTVGLECGWEGCAGRVRCQGSKLGSQQPASARIQAEDTFVIHACTRLSILITLPETPVLGWRLDPKVEHHS